MKSDELLEQVKELLAEARAQADNPDLKSIDELDLKLTVVMSSVNQRYVAHEMESNKFRQAGKDIQEVVRSLRRFHETLLEEKKSTR